MSTSFVARNIFEKVRTNFPDYIIKFSSGNPRNPVNQAGPEELDMIKYFNENPLDKIWTGEINMGGRRYIAQFSAMRMEKTCLRCHGDPADAPFELIKRYGPNASFYLPLGEVVGLDTIAIPSEKVNERLWQEKARNIGFLGILILLLCASLVFIFKFIITDRLSVITDHFLHTEKQGEDVTIGAIEMKGQDEIAVLAGSFNKLAERLNDSYAKLKIEIEERKQAQKALRESEQFLRSVIDHASIVLWGIDKDGIFTFSEGKVLEKLGLRPGEVVGCSLFEIYADNPKIVSDARRVLKGEAFSSETEANGIRFESRYSPMKNDDGSVIGAIGVAMDVTERKQAETSLRESEEKYRTLFDMESDALALMDIETGNILDANKAFINLYGFSKEEVLNMKNTDFSEEPEETQKSVLGHNPFIPLRYHRKKDGTVFPTEICASIFEYQGREVLIAAVRDITDRMKAEEQIKSSLREKEILLREIHHRVKNNFEIVSSLLDMSSMRSDNPETQNLLINARSRIHSMSLIHSQLYQSDRFDQIDMDSHIRELSQHLLCVYGKGEKIDLILTPSQVYLSVSQAIPCALVLNELISNVFKHAFRKKKQGTVRISISTPEPSTVLVQVKDDGDGIPEGTDSSSQTGLGLKMARYLVSGQLKGEMRVRNDNGTEISIQFKRSNNGKKHA
jgi:PAS domain S-box-containing protein